MISAIGRIPTIAAPAAAPTIASSEIGVICNGNETYDSERNWRKNKNTEYLFNQKDHDLLSPGNYFATDANIEAP